MLFFLSFCIFVFLFFIFFIFYFFRYTNVLDSIVCLRLNVLYCLLIPYFCEYQLRVICSADSIKCRVEAAISVQRG